MTQKNSEWDDKIQVKKGNLGEEIVDKFLELKGFVIYKPMTKSAHWFDRVAIKDKERIIIAECKTKARRNNYNDTGFNLKNYEEYVKFQNKFNIKVYIFFVDEMVGKIYGNWLSIISKPCHSINPKRLYPLIEGKIIYFNLEMMELISTLSNTEIDSLKILSTRKHEYKI